MAVIDSFDLNWILLWTCVWTAIYYYVLRTWNHFRRYGIPFDRGVPPFGSYYRYLFKCESWSSTLKRLYYQHPNERFIGMYEIGGGVSYLIRDPELVKDITTTHFDHFVNKIDTVDRQTDPLYSRMLTLLKGDDWRDMRALMTPLFTGSKFRTVLMPAMIEAQQRFVEHLVATIDGNTEKSIDMQDQYNRVVIDAFGRCALGIGTDAVTHEASEFNLAYDNLVGHMESMHPFVRYAIGRWPKLSKYLFGKTALSLEGGAFFERVIADAAAERRRSKVDRPDFLGLVVNARRKAEETTAGYTEVDMVSQCLVFFLSVITENNILLNFITQALADDVEIQQRLRDEMLTINEQLRGATLTMDTLRDMKYMDMVMSEALRMCPIAPQLRRRATKPFTLTNSNGAQIRVQPNEAIWMPTHVIQNDPKYYSQPDKFDPERFSDANKADILAGIYAPFGMGSRDCIGCRYVVMKVKIAYFYLLQTFDLIRGEGSTTGKGPITLRKRAICVEL